MDLSRSSLPHAARHLRWVVPTCAVAALALVGLAASDPSLPVDDAYISFSYARTLSSGAGLALTPRAAPVEAFSNPLWVFILALVARLGAALPQAAVVLAFGAAMATALQLAATTRRFTSPPWPLVALVTFVLAPGVGFHIASGLETMAATLALLVAFDAVAGRSDLVFGPRAVVASLALAWLRPEGVLVVVGWALLSRRSEASRRSLLAWAIAYVVYLAFRWTYFGHLLPNSIVAKRGVDLATTVVAGRAYLEHFARLHAPILVLAGVGLVSLPRRAALAVAAPLAVFGAVAFAGAHAEGYPYQRYLWPVVPLAIVCAARGASTLADVARRRGMVASAGYVVLMAGLVAVQLVIRTATDWSVRDVPRRAHETALRWSHGDRAPHDVSYPPYHRLSAWLAQRARPGDTIAMQEIGITAFYSGIGVLDTFGLADAHIARLAGRPGGKVDAAYVFAGAPSVFAIRLAADGLRPGLLADDAYASDPRLAYEYDLERLFPDTATPLVATFTRRDGLVAAESLMDRVPAPARLAAPAPSFLEQVIRRRGLGAEAMAASGRLHFKRWIEGVQWNDASPDGATSMTVDVPAIGRASFEVTLAPPAAFSAGRFSVAVTASDGQHAEVAHTFDPGTPSEARDIALDLTRWNGQRLRVTLAYAGGPPEARAPGWLIWQLPRLVRLRPTAHRRPAAPLPRPSLDAVVVAQQVPDQMTAGRPYVVTITMRNTGSRTWTARGQHRLGSQSPVDGRHWAIGRVTLDDVEAIAPDQERTFRFTVTAPREPGLYGFQWRMLEEGVEWFGATTPLVNVRVVAP